MKTTTKTVKLVMLQAEEGKVFQRIDSGDVLGSTLYLGAGDKADNYEEIDKPAEDEEPTSE